MSMGIVRDGIRWSRIRDRFNRIGRIGQDGIRWGLIGYRVNRSSSIAGNVSGGVR